jgi:hypothetical protein
MSTWTVSPSVTDTATAISAPGGNVVSVDVVVGVFAEVVAAAVVDGLVDSPTEVEVTDRSTVVVTVVDTLGKVVGGVLASGIDSTVVGGRMSSAAATLSPDPVVTKPLTMRNMRYAATPSSKP